MPAWRAIAFDTYLKLGVTCLLNVTIHVNFVIKSLVMLYDETFKGSVFIAIKLLH